MILVQPSIRPASSIAAVLIPSTQIGSSSCTPFNRLEHSDVPVHCWGGCNGAEASAMKEQNEQSLYCSSVNLLGLFVITETPRIYSLFPRFRRPSESVDCCHVTRTRSRTWDTLIFILPSTFVDFLHDLDLRLILTSRPSPREFSSNRDTGNTIEPTVSGREPQEGRLFFVQF